MANERRSQGCFCQKYVDSVSKIARLEEDVARLRRENAELRKLLVDFRDAMWNGGEWTESFDERMRDLGIEVD